MPLLLDTGVIYALADADDAWHTRARHYLRRVRELLLVPVTVVPEATYLLRTRLGAQAELKFVNSLALGEAQVAELTAADLERCVALLETYTAIGFVDCSVVAIAERLGVRTLATTDRRHFGSIRPRHVHAFELVP